MVKKGKARMPESERALSATPSFGAQAERAGSEVSRRAATLTDLAARLLQTVGAAAKLVPDDYFDPSAWPAKEYWNLGPYLPNPDQDAFYAVLFLLRLASGRDPAISVRRNALLNDGFYEQCTRQIANCIGFIHAYNESLTF